jgi:hypothetical protein
VQQYEAERRPVKVRVVHVLALPIISSPVEIGVTLETEPLRGAAEQTAAALLQEATKAVLVVLVVVGSKPAGQATRRRALGRAQSPENPLFE